MDKMISRQVAEDFISDLMRDNDLDFSIPRVIGEFRKYCERLNPELDQLVDSYLNACRYGRGISFWREGVQFEFGIDLTSLEFLNKHTVGVLISDCDVIDSEKFDGKLVDVFRERTDWINEFIMLICLESEQYSAILERGNRIAEYLVEHYGDSAIEILESKVIPEIKRKVEEEKLTKHFTASF